MIRKLEAIVVCALVAALCFACAPAQKVRVTVLESSDGFVVLRADADGGSVADALAELDAQGKLTCTVEQGQYGAFVTSLNGVVPEAGAFVALYTTVGTVDGTAYSDASFGTKDYHGTALYSATYGVSGLPLFTGELYLLCIEVYAA